MTQRATTLYDDTGNADPDVTPADGATTAEGYKQFDRKQDDIGLVKIDFFPDSAPGAVTVSLQGRISNPAGTYSPEEYWVTLTSVTEAELGASGGTFFETISMFPYMRVAVSGAQAADRVRVYVLE